ncbi:MAG: phage holin family protein [Dysgonomonas mossii]|uniref:phage holin family protein n=1 Tax=Dysgonomonas mossii TaxID=163665 RepID=UPI001E0EEAC0|nr:phage holin family protein [Dysgonomonas mossii]MBS5797068.1 phage holin family protein [Dysgonomonas mossii]MBS7111905.1 phage holin family protein [Dysgonomonas mossii]
MDNNYTDGFLIGLLEFFIWAKWLLALAFLLTMADLKFGISAAKYRNEIVKRSRAVRRTLDKITNYCLWIILAYTFGQAFGQPFGIDLLPLIILLVIYGVELESIYVNYFAAKGKKVKVNVFKFFSKKNDIIEVEKKEDDNGN